jgi:hypothetical protein
MCGVLLWCRAAMLCLRSIFCMTWYCVTSVDCGWFDEWSHYPPSMEVTQHQIIQNIHPKHNTTALHHKGSTRRRAARVTWRHLLGQQIGSACGIRRRVIGLFSWNPQSSTARAESLWGSWKNRFCGARPITSRARPDTWRVWIRFFVNDVSYDVKRAEPRAV